MSVLIHHHPCNSKHFFYLYHFAPSANHSVHTSIYPIPKIPNPYTKSCKSLRFSSRLPKFRRGRVQFCTKNGVEFKDTLLPQNAAREEESESLELLDKPSLKEVENGSVEEREEIEAKELNKDEVLEPFYRFFKPFGEESVSESGVGTSAVEGREKISVEYYEAKAGDLVVGVVVSGNESKLDVNVGADLLGTMLTKDVLPLSDKEMEHLLCDVEKDGQEFLVPGKMGIVKYDEAMSGQPLPGKPVVEPGTVLFAEVLGRTLGGRPLLSSRKLFRRIAWHRVRQIKQLNEPIEVKITEWNTGGLLTRVEGLRAFLPKAELMNRVNNFTELKENVGRRLRVLITRINEDTNDLILGEREAWEKSNLQEGTLLVGTVKKIFPYGAQIRIGDTNRSGLLHISKISRERIASVSDVLAIDEEVKVLVVKSMFPGKIALSIAELESEPGLFLSNKERLYHEAKEMAMKYRQRISPVSTPQKPEAHPTDEGLPFEDDERLYSNWKWFEFERDNEQSP